MPPPTHIETGYLLSKVDYRDSDLVVTLFTAGLGRVSALARGARSSRRRFGGVLEPMHTLTLHLDERPTSELFVLREASIVVARTRLVSRLAALEAAGKALAWLRHGSPQRSAEPQAFVSVSQLLDRLNQATPGDLEPIILAEFGLFLLTTFGFGLDFDHCIRCSRACARGQAAFIDARRGGLVCRACGGAARHLAGDVRQRLSRASAGQIGVLEMGDSEAALELIEQALRSHMGIEPR
jgi:DNA repair protein RecO (recombination protein O)